MLISEIKCPTNIPNGTLQNCQANIGSSCNFLCDHGFHKKSGVTSIACLATGFWTNDIDELCVRKYSIPNNLCRIFNLLNSYSSFYAIISVINIKTTRCSLYSYLKCSFCE